MADRTKIQNELDSLTRKVIASGIKDTDKAESIVREIYTLAVKNSVRSLRELENEINLWILCRKSEYNQLGSIVPV